MYRRNAHRTSARPSKRPKTLFFESYPGPVWVRIRLVTARGFFARSGCRSIGGPHMYYRDGRQTLATSSKWPKTPKNHLFWVFFLLFSYLRARLRDGMHIFCMGDH